MTWTSASFSAKTERGDHGVSAVGWPAWTCVGDSSAEGTCVSAFADSAVRTSSSLTRWSLRCEGALGPAQGRAMLDVKVSREQSGALSRQ
jgi:hypothetical protein